MRWDVSPLELVKSRDIRRELLGRLNSFQQMAILISKEQSQNDISPTPCACEEKKLNKSQRAS